MNPLVSAHNGPDVVGCYTVRGQTHFLGARYAELERSAPATAAIIGTFNFTHGGVILIVSLVQEVVQFVAFERAAGILGLYGINAEYSPYDASRVESICRQFNPVAVCGVGRATLEGLRMLKHDPAKVFAQRVVWARPDAFESIKAMPSVSARRMGILGPAVAFECAHGGLHYDGRDWALHSHAGTLHVSSRMPRIENVMNLDTGIAGSVSCEPCTCGVRDAVIQLEG